MAWLKNWRASWRSPLGSFSNSRRIIKSSKMTCSRHKMWLTKGSNHNSEMLVRRLKISLISNSTVRLVNTCPSSLKKNSFILRRAKSLSATMDWSSGSCWRWRNVNTRSIFSWYKRSMRWHSRLLRKQSWRLRRLLSWIRQASLTCRSKSTRKSWLTSKHKWQRHRPSWCRRMLWLRSYGPRVLHSRSLMCRASRFKINFWPTQKQKWLKLKPKFRKKTLL